MSLVLDKVRAKYPQYKDVPDADLTMRLGATYPQYLEDKEFAADFGKYAEAAWTSLKAAPVNQPTAPTPWDTTPGDSVQSSVPSVQPTPPRTRTLAQWPRELLGLPTEAEKETADTETATRKQLVSQYGQEWHDQQVKAIGAKYQYLRGLAGDNTDKLAQANEMEKQELRSVGVEPIGVNEPVNLPKLTEGEAKTLFGESRLGKAAAVAQRTAVGIAESFATPEGGAMIGGPGLARKLAGVAKPLTKAEFDALPSQVKAAYETAHRIGQAYVPGMAKTAAEKLGEAAGAYSGGDKEAGDAALAEGLTTAAMLLPTAKQAGLLPNKLPSLPEISLKPKIGEKAPTPGPPYPAEARGLGIGPERWSVLTDDQRAAVTDRIIAKALEEAKPAPAPQPVPVPAPPVAASVQTPVPSVQTKQEETGPAKAGTPYPDAQIGINADADVAMPLKHGEGATLVDQNGKAVEQISDSQGNQRWVLTKEPEQPSETPIVTPGPTEPSRGNVPAAEPEAPAVEPMKYGVPESQWDEMANFNDHEQRAKWGTSRAELMQKEILGKFASGAYYTPENTIKELAELIRAGKVTKSDAMPLLGKQFAGTMAEGKFTAKDLGDAFEMALNRVVQEGTTPAFMDADPAQAVGNIATLKELLNRTPTQTSRTREMDKLQQFSTPPPLAYVANWVANLKASDVVLEPSAGVGGLAVFAKAAGAKVIGNELSPRRADLLRASGTADFVTTHNAEHLDALMEPAFANGEMPRPTAVVMNPPFSNAANTDRKNTLVGAKHVEEALKMLPEGGRLVAIVGRGMAMDRPMFAPWWKKITGQYNVRANVQVNGAEYKKYGTAFDNQIVVIDKNGKTPDATGIVQGRVEKVEDLIPLLERIRNERPGIAGTEPAPAESSGAEAAPVSNGPAINAPAGPGTPGAGAGGGERERSQRNDAGGKQGAGGLGKAGRGKTGRGTKVSGGPGPGVGGESGPEVSGASSDRDLKGSVQRDAVAATSEGISLEKLNEARKQLNEQGVFSEYQPRKVRIKGAQPHVSPLVEPTAMAAVDPVDPTYTPKLPRELITSGKLSATGIENVVYAGQAHSKTLPNGDRMGYFIGDGTGVGKGRQIVGIILDNWNQGRRRSLWVSKNIDLINDAKRDFEDMGLPVDRVIDFQKNNGKGLIGAKDGTAFVPYSSLRSDSPGLTKEGTLFPPEPIKDKPGEFKRTRMHLLQDWAGKDFDGVIVFDEAHMAGNAIDVKGKRGIKRASLQGRMVLDVQRLFPKARIVYASATGATDVTNLSYADRLGIWGHGTPFTSKEYFFDQIRRGGLSAMEIVARDLKSMGRYLARTLSFEGVDHRQLVHKLSNEQRGIYDELARAWQYVLQHRNETMAMTNAAKDGRARSAANSAFYGAQQRFYIQLLTAMQMPSILSDVKAELAKGHSAVLQLVNTDEAAQTRQIAAKASEGGDNYLEDLDLSPKEILLQYIENSYPTQLFEKVLDENGNEQWKPMRDAQGKPVLDPQAIRRKQELSDKIALLKAPSAPLSMLLDQMGVENVAEITGRSKRVVDKLQPDGTRKRVLEKNRGPAQRKIETEEFQAGKKRVLVFSDAGGTGKSYHASRTAKNQQRRIHYLMQAGWKADAALQGFGRTHRSNQSSAPEYVLASTDIKGHQRFISTIARRLAELGALTGGERKSKGGEMFDETSNLENSYAEDGVFALFNDLHAGQVPGANLWDIARKLGYTKQVVSERSGEVKEINTLIDEDTGGLNAEKVPTIQQFLNRILSLEVAEQNHLFDAFLSRMTKRIKSAKEDGSYDPGTQILKAKAIRKVSDEQVYKDPESTAATRLVKIEHDHPQTKVRFDQLASGEPVTSYVLNNRSARVYALKQGPTRTTAAGGMRSTFYRLHPGGSDVVFADELDPNNYTTLDETKARTIWADQLASLPKYRTDTDSYVVGAFLPIWDRLQMDAPKIWRITTDKDETMLGAHVPAREVAALRARLGAGMADRTPEDVFQGVMQGEGLKLANGWRVNQRRVLGEKRIEVTGPTMGDLKEFEQHLGGFMERIGYTPRFFLPTDETKGTPAMAKLIKKAPLAGPEAVSHPMVSGETVQAARELMLERLGPDKVRFTGERKSTHVERVAARAEGDFDKTVAYLHDLREDSNTSDAEIRAKFGDRVADAVDAETWRKDSESYEQYIERLSKNPDAIPSKLRDLEDNLRTLPKGWRRVPQSVAKQAQWSAARLKLNRALREPDTIYRATMPDARTPREPFRQEQIRRVLSRVQPVPMNEQPTAIFMGGGPAGGKTTTLKMLVNKGSIDENSFVMVAADNFKTGTTELPSRAVMAPEFHVQAIPEFLEQVAKEDPKASELVHKESSLMASAALARALSERKNVVFDGTMSKAIDRDNPPQSDLKMIEAAKQAGYRVEMYGVTRPTEMAVAEAKRRGDETKRYVPENVVRRGHRGFAKSWGNYLEHVDEATLFDTSSAEGEVIAHKDEGGLAIFNEKAYDLFRERADEKGPKEQPASGQSAPGEIRDTRPETGGAEVYRRGRGEGSERGPGAGEGALPDGLARVEHPFLSGTGIAQDLAKLRAAVAPQSVNDAAHFAANVLRELNSKMANEMARADRALRSFRWDFDRTPVAKDYRYDPVSPLPRNLAFIDAYEGGRTAGMTAKEAEAANEMARQNAEWVARVRALGKGALDTLIVNYFPHLWDNPVKARSVMAAVMAKKPLEGSRGFLKERTYDLFREGLAAGLKPVHDNPVDLWLLKKREVEKFIMGQKFIQIMAEAGLRKFVYVFNKAPDGWTRVDDRAFEVYGPPTVTIKEAFDAGMRAKTLEVLQHLGVPHERLMKIGGQQWGRESDVPGKPGTERITTKFGGPDFVMWHELGHALDNRYSDLRDTLMGTEAERQQIAVATMRGQPVPAALTRTATLNAELRALADQRVGSTATAAFKQHVRTTPEKMATVLQAFLHAPDLMARVAPTVKAAWERFMTVHPELGEINDIRPSLRLGEGEAQLSHGGLLKMGNYYLPDAAARVVNNYLSPGLNPYAWYRGLRQVSNLLNGVQLGLSAFHLGFTSLDAATSRLAVGIEDVMRGKVLSAVKTFATVPVSPVTNILQGRKLFQEAMRPGSTDAATAEMVRALEAGGGRVGQDAFWRTEFTRRMMRAVHEGTASGYLKGALAAPFALWEQTMRPIMEYIVPRQKLGVFADMAKREILRLGPNAAAADVRAAMQKAWDSVDNRMGQMVYDNLFYNRAIKDVALLSFRAYGWQLGKYREGLGAVADTARAAKALAGLNAPEFTHRMAYVMALPIMVGTLGGIAHYLMTGTQPTGKDWFMPRTGEKDAKGNDLRLNFPSYVKDMISYTKHPLTSFGHSLNPLGALMMDLLQNKDFYDVRIRNPADPLWKQGSDVAQFAAKQFMPFSVSNALKMRQDDAPVRKQILPFFGITPVPSRITMTPAQELASELTVDAMPKAARSKEQFDRSKLVAEIVADLKSPEAGRMAAGKGKFYDGISRQQLTLGATMTIIEKLGYTPLQFQVHHLDSESAMRVWRVANGAERQQILPLVASKVANSKTLTMERKAQFLDEMRAGR